MCGMTKNRLIDVQNYQRETLDFLKQEILAMAEMDRQDAQKEVITDEDDFETYGEHYSDLKNGR